MSSKWSITGALTLNNYGIRYSNTNPPTNEYYFMNHCTDIQKITHNLIRLILKIILKKDNYIFTGYFVKDPRTQKFNNSLTTIIKYVTYFLS